ncbi:unnamed protein product [Effrenium voratum]|uniref:Multidrug and toxin extrusion protein n=1 Tax=Effrenium voratum TaxID=2562239 RepID=A0AA36HSL5_9DINO|nr:unnamed protein product [Effrenium voratum]CAJ1412235.1 unnamed protein product [Effrenium voratum]
MSMEPMAVLRPTEEPTPLRASLRELSRIALPMMVSNTLMLLNEFTNMICLSHVGNTAEMAAVGLGNMMQNCFALSLGLGLTSALDTLVSAAHGAEHFGLCCHYLQRCRALCTLQLLWMIPLLWFTEPFLLALRQDPRVARHAASYNRVAVFGLFANFQHQSNIAFLRNKRLPGPVTWIAVCTSVLHIAWAAVFIVVLDLGNRGAGFANVSTWTLQFSLSSSIVLCRKRQLAGTACQLLGVQQEAFRCWKGYLAVAIPSTVMLCSNSWFWDLCVLVVGTLGPTALAAHVATLNLVCMLVQPPVALGLSAASVVGNCIGAGAPRKARQTAWMAVALDAALWAGLAAIFFLAREDVAALLTSKPKVRSVVALLLTIYLGAGFFDTPAYIMAAVLRGLGMQKVPAATYTVCYYFLMLPLGAYFAWRLQMGVSGVWYATLVGTALSFVIMMYALWHVDWQRRAGEAQRRLEADSKIGSRAPGL